MACKRSAVRSRLPPPSFWVSAVLLIGNLVREKAVNSVKYWLAKYRKLYRFNFQGPHRLEA